MEAGPDRQTDNEDGIGEYDDGKTGKLTLSILLAEGLIEPGEGVMSIDYLGQSFKGDLLAVGKIRSVETGLVFNNPSVSSFFDREYGTGRAVDPIRIQGFDDQKLKNYTYNIHFLKYFLESKFAIY
jgi:hypothetical protein